MADASVIVRCLNKAATIRSTLEALRAQTCAAELIIVDSGSTDGTLDIARNYADKVVQIPSEQFSYGGALNIGASAATAPFHFAVSAHCTPADQRWIENTLRHYCDPLVAAVNGTFWDMHDRRATKPILQSSGQPGPNPYWGYSNTTGSWRASVWREHPFREDLVACEDKEWSWRVIAAGYRIVYDPHLLVPTRHRYADGYGSLYRRVYKEGFAMGSLGVISKPTLLTLLERWWRYGIHHDTRRKLLRRFGIARNVELLARHHGELRGCATTRGRLPRWPPADPLGPYDGVKAQR